jgi:hypothetical protein
MKDTIIIKGISDANVNLNRRTLKLRLLFTKFYQIPDEIAYGLSAETKTRK